MPKNETRFVCQTCGHQSPRWLGRCPECDAWNTMVEETVERPKAVGARAAARQTLGTACVAVPIGKVQAVSVVRSSSGIGELDRVLGGGLVPGSVVLVGGDPGIGKSTLLTQVSARRCGDGATLYVSGEESLHQIRMRAERLGALPDSFLVANETDVGSIVGLIADNSPSLVVVDSVQTCQDPSLESAPGTVSQIRDCAAALTRAAKAGGTPLVLIGHVTKEGMLAGPRVLEHMVDTVLYFEGDRHSAYRVLRCVKNRFGSTDEVGLFEMHEDGLMEVTNPSAALLAERTPDSTGSAVAAVVEGTRPLLVETQALVARSYLSSPRRTVTGMDFNRVNLLLAVLEKRLGLRLGDQDVFVNVAGGVRVIEPAADLATAMAVASSFREQPVNPSAALIGEVGLGGEVRAVTHIERRLREAARLGFGKAIIPQHNARGGRVAEGLEVIRVSTVLEAMRAALLPPSA